MIEFLKYVKKFSYWIIPILAWYIVGILGDIPLSIAPNGVIAGLFLIMLIISGFLTWLAILFTINLK